MRFHLWSKLIAPIFIHYDIATTLAKAYIQVYNGKSRHLGVYTQYDYIINHELCDLNHVCENETRFSRLGDFALIQ